MREAGRIVAEVLRPRRVASSSPGVTTGHLDELAERAHPASRRRSRRSRATRRQPAPAVPGSVCISHRRRDRPRHPGRAGHPRRPDRLASTSAPSSTAGTATRADRSTSASHPAAVRASSTRPRPRCWRASPRPCRATDIERHLGRRRGRRAAARLSGSSASSSATASGREMHEEPQVPNYRTGRPRPQLEPGPVPGDRADVHARRPRGPCPGATTGRSSPSTGRWPPTSSTRSPITDDGAEVLTAV